MVRSVAALRRRLRPRAVLAFPVALLMSAGCGDTTEPDPSITDSLRFSYSGALSGTFSGSGHLPLNAAGVPTSLPASAAAAIVRPGGLTLVAVRGTGANEADVLTVYIGSFTGVGSYSMNLAACGNPDDASGCRAGAFMPSASLAELQQAVELGGHSLEGVFVAAAGTVTVTHYDGGSNGRIRGTFSLQAAAAPSTGFSSVTITNGQFELPVRMVP